MSIQVFPLLRNCEVKGAYFRKDSEPDLKEYIAAIPPGESVTVVPDPTNEYDEYCANVYHGDRWIGFIPKECSAAIHFLAHVNSDHVAEVLGHAKNGNPRIILAATWDEEDE